MHVDAGAEHKARMRTMFNQQAADYDAAGPGCFTWFGRRLVDEVGIQPGAHVLDVASGRGAVLFPATAQVGPAGSAVGIDLSDEMARFTNADAQRRGLDTQVRVMDAERLDFDDASFDAVLCGFGIMFFPDQQRALREFQRVLKLGGRLGVSTWQVAQSQDLGAVLQELDLGWSRGPGWIASPEGLEELLTQAGFADVRVTADTHQFCYADIDEYWQTARGTQIRHRIDALDAEQTARVRAAFAERVEPHRRSDGFYLAATALLAVAHR